MAQIGRLSDGKFAEGHKLATGRKPSVFQSYPDRADHLLQLLTRSQILDTADNDLALDQFSSFDCLILTNLANAFKNDNHLNREFGALERERLLDRGGGKPAQEIKGVKNVNNTFNIAGFGADAILGAIELLTGSSTGNLGDASCRTIEAEARDLQAIPKTESVP